MNVKMIVSYDGGHFAGWQKQKNTRDSIEEVLNKALSQALLEPIEVIGASRTDAGVHAQGQVCSFHTKSRFSPEEIRSKAQPLLPQSIVILSAEAVDDRFHARYNAKTKEYVYRMMDGGKLDPFRRHTVLFVSDTLDLPAMERALPLLSGAHDYRAFMTGHSNKSTEKTVEITLERAEGEIRFHFRGDGFLYNQIRIMMGTLLEIGAHSREVGTIPGMLASKDRKTAGHTAPPQGLCLMKVEY